MPVAEFELSRAASGAAALLPRHRTLPHWLELGSRTALCSVSYSSRSFLFLASSEGRALIHHPFGPFGHFSAQTALSETPNMRHIQNGCFKSRLLVNPKTVHC